MDEILSSGVEFMIIPDASTSDYTEHKILADNNIPCVVLEHHPCDKYSKYALVVNNQLSKNVVNKSGSGCLVTFKICQLLNKNYSNKLIDIVWFSLLSDIMDMSSMENRTFAYWGKRKLTNRFLIAMVDKYIYQKGKELNNISVSWSVQPKISAIIRCEDEVAKQNLFMAIATEQDKYINYVLDNCDKIHTKQGDIVKKYFEQMEETIDETNNIIFEPIDIYPYYSGLVASKINDKFNRPAILYRLSKNGYTGSVRSPIPIKQELIDSGVFTFCSGHDSALGVGFKEYDFDNIREYVKDAEIDDTREVMISCQAKDIPSNIFHMGYDNIDLFGQGIPYPQVHVHPFQIFNTDISSLKGNTIKIHNQGIDFMMFMVSNKTKERLYIGENKQKIEIECIVEPSLNIYNGRVSNQCIIKYFEVREVEKLTFADIWGE